MKITCWKIITITWSPRDLLLPFMSMFPPLYSSHPPTKLVYKLVFLACEEEFVAIICANNFTSWIGACIILWVHLFAYVPCIISWWVHFLAYIPCSMSLWVYFLAYAPCNKREHVSNIWVLPYVLKGIPIWLFFICLILLFLIYNSKGWHFFVFIKINLGHVAILLSGYYLESLNSLQVKVLMCKQNLDSITMSPKKIQFNYNLLGCFHPPWFRKKVNIFSYKTLVWLYTFFFWSIYNLKFLEWPCWVKTHKEPKRVLDVKHIWSKIKDLLSFCHVKTW
jgi:hypothetical protein